MIVRSLILSVIILGYVCGQGFGPDSLIPVSADMITGAITRAEQLLQDGLAAASTNLSVGPECLNHTEMFISALAHGQTWAVRMVDAIGKPSSGLLDLHVTWLGSYDECVAIEAAVNNSGLLTHPYKGRYCKASFKLGKSQASFLSPQGGATITVGVCVPNSCSSLDTSSLLDTLLSLLPLNTSHLPAPDTTCQYETLQYDTKAIVVITVCSLFALVMVSATLYDIILQLWCKKMVNSPTTYEVMKESNSTVNLTDNTAVSNVLATDVVTSLDAHAKYGTTENGHVLNMNTANKFQQDPEPGQPGTLGKILLSFSIYTNARKLLNVNQPSGTLTAVNGIRFISMTWVILGHTYYFGLMAADNLATFLPNVLKRFTYQAIVNALVAVDTFFALSGLLVAYLSLKEMKKRGGALKFKWGLYYFHRFWRLTPPYMLFLMLYVPLIKYWSNGPLWPQKGIEINECEGSWWTNLLYINNLAKTKEGCMGWSWYLANDMQFFVVSPFMLIPLYYSKVLGTLSCCFLLLINFVCTGVKSSVNHLEPGMVNAMNPNFGDIYTKPWNRIGPYAVGFYAGYILYKTDCKIKIPKVVNVLCWTVATAVALLVLYGLYDSSGQPHFSNSVSALYNATHRSAWAAAVCWVIIACATGHGGWINTLLSWKGIIPLSRLTYCAYLVHPVVMITYYFSRRTLVYYTDLEMSVLFCGFMVLSYATAFIVSLAFESPMMGLEKVLLGRGKNS